MGILARVEQRRGISESNTGCSRPGRLDLIADVLADEEAVDRKQLHTPGGIGGVALGEQVDDLDVLQFVGPVDQSLHQRLVSAQPCR